MFLSPADRERLLGLLDDGRPVRDYELELRTRSEKSARSPSMPSGIEVGGEACYLTFVRDVTARRLAEAEAQEQRLQVAHLSRVAMLGELSGALAHELNQPLTAILANARAAQRLMAQERPDLGRFGRSWARSRMPIGGRARSSSVSARSSTRERCSSARWTSTSGVRSADADPQRPDPAAGHGGHDRPAPHLPTVIADRVQMQQVLLNLLLNACDAISPDALDRRVTISTAAGADDTVELSLADRGTGYPGGDAAHLRAVLHFEARWARPRPVDLPLDRDGP
jgi:signal transduction histidine kinase